MAHGRGRLTAGVIAVGCSVAACVGLAACGSGASDLGEPVAATSTVGSLDWDHVTYGSVCGLSEVVVDAGVGESSTVNGVFGVEVIDAAVGDLDGQPGEEAAVLVDCLGADAYRPHVIVVSSDGVLEGGAAQVVVASSGGSVASGDRPVSIAIGAPATDQAPGTIDVVVEHRGAEIVHQLEYAPSVLRGAELPVSPGTDTVGALVAVEKPDPKTYPGAEVVLVLAVTPDDGYRVPAPAGLEAVDPDTGAVVGAGELIGRSVSVSTDPAGLAAGIDVLPAGGA